MLSTAVYWSLTITSWLGAQAYQPHQNSFASNRDFASGLDFVFKVAAFIFTGIWLARARRNAVRIALTPQRRDKMWVWLGWIVPIVSLWYPKQVIDDVWRATLPSEPTTRWWWGTWIASQLLGGFADSWASGLKGPVPGTTNLTNRVTWIEDLVWLELLAALAMTIALPLWIRVVRTITTAQEARADVEVSPR